MFNHLLRVCGIMAVLLLPGRARASLFGEENGPLTTLVAQAAVQISQAAETFATLKETYDETKRYVSMAQDAVNAFEDMKSFGDSIINRPDQALGQLFPDLTSVRGELDTPASWMKGTGELQRRVQVCLSGGQDCGQFYERLRGRQAQEAITGTFGTVPAGVIRNDLAASDSEAAAALVNASIQEGKASVSREKFDALMAKCTAGDITSCQAAANMANILEAKGVADLNEQMATSNRLQATQLANQSGAQKREVREAQQRAKAVLDGFDDMQRSTIVPRERDLRQRGEPVDVGEVP